MKATIERATLLKSLGHVQSVVERRNTIPILSNQAPPTDAPVTDVVQNKKLPGDGSLI